MSSTHSREASPGAHPEVATLVHRILIDDFGGVADVARAVASALAAVARDGRGGSAAEVTAKLQSGAKDLLRSLPTFAPPINALHRVMGAIEAVGDDASGDRIADAAIAACDAFLDYQTQVLDRTARAAAEKVPDGGTVFMYSMSKTVWRALEFAKADGKSFKVLVTESRPACEGRWTVAEMQRIGVPCAIGIDACMGDLVAESDVVFVGADAIASNGGTLCKVGTYPTALVARHHGKPFYILADTLKFDATSLLGYVFQVEDVPAHLVPGPDGVESHDVVGKLFDVTPAELIEGIVTERGVFAAAAVGPLMVSLPRSAYIDGLIPAWARHAL